MSNIYIIQNGKDGTGHQLHGLFSSIILHGVGNYYFSGHDYINKIFKFQHIGTSISIDVKNYFIEIVKQFINMNNQNIKNFKSTIHSHEIYYIPENYDSDTLYSIDNAYYFDRIPINDSERIKHNENIYKYKSLFINDKLPKNRLVKNNIVIHVRLGDALTCRKDAILKNNKDIVLLLDILLKKYKNYTYYLHSDGNIDFLLEKLSKNNADYKLFEKDEHVLNVLSDFIHSKIFITGLSGLSTVCTFLGEHEEIIIPDGVKHSVPDNVIRISDYINKNKNEI